ncbi:basic helix-loop-helix (bHLH) DNA-binding superfamily protein [Actinidia rufa]|uniref:Basic helix-loop-helix (BHLH) DNA-binding superfamily protein n=1 Tax=Actinidia rufa TaxID=165716 RepID=A0A7J0EGR9_9ERIC|nr:basic helix-loop-helix (bHLH) DNA-binding superfamily protein [Actinidia rufa]
MKNRSCEEMVRSMQSHQDEEEDEDEELDPRTTDGSSQKVKVDDKSTGQKVNALRSKHSETEQRRRSKINERQGL